MKQPPFSTLLRIHVTNDYCLSLIAVMESGQTTTNIETYRFLHQRVENGIPSRINYETVFDNGDAAKEYFEEYKKEKQFHNPDHVGILPKDKP